MCEWQHMITETRC